METPQYEHDCSEEFGCAFVGRFEKYDIWYHADQNCIIYRYSSDGPDYGTSHLGWADLKCAPEGIVGFHEELRHLVLEYLTRQNSPLYNL